MSKQIVHIDESGDMGLLKAHTSTLRIIVAAVLVTESDNLTELVAAIDGFRAGLGWRELDEFKFSSTRKSVIKDLLKFIQKYDFEAYAVVIDKSRIFGVPTLSPDETLHGYAIKELLLKIKLSEPTIVIDGIADRKPAQRMKTYLRRALKQHGVEKCKISFVDSRRESMIQLADIVAGSIARSFDTSKADHNDYTELLKSKIKGIYEISP